MFIMENLKSRIKISRKVDVPIREICRNVRGGVEGRDEVEEHVEGEQ